MLILASMPIGNDLDVPFRTIQELSDADLIVAEDLRHLIQFCNKKHIKTKENFVELQYNDKYKDNYEKIIKEIKLGKKVIMLSECGMPTINDPGSEIVEKVKNNNLPYTCIPGPNAGLTALTLSGFNTNNFLYCGFLPKENLNKKNFLLNIKNLQYTSIFLESKNRIIETIDIMIDIFNQEDFFIGINLTSHNEFKSFGKNLLEIKKDVEKYLSKNKYSVITVCIGFQKPTINLNELEIWTSID